jgi:hypothetical protein
MATQGYYKGCVARSLERLMQAPCQFEANYPNPWLCSKNIKLHRQYSNIKISIHIQPYTDTSYPPLLPKCLMENKNTACLCKLLVKKLAKFPLSSHKNWEKAEKRCSWPTAK